MQHFFHWNVIGHTKELEEIEQDILNNNIHHAYLFIGPEKIGKYRIAKSMAGILQCPNNFCHACSTCIQIEKKCHADTIELEDDNESIKINTVREIIERLNMTGQNKYKILLIQNAKRLTEEAANCILKMLEEPPEKTIFIFTAGQMRDVLPTIVSRMRAIHFKKLPDDILKQSLQKLYPTVDEDTLNQALLLSLGRSGKAIQLLSEPETLRELLEFYRQIQFLDAKASLATRFIAVQKLIEDPVRIKMFLSLLIYHLRRKIFQEKTFAAKKRAIEAVENIHRASNLLARNINPRLLLENIMLQL